MARRALLAPVAAIGAALAVLTAVDMVLGRPSVLTGIDLLLAGALWMTAGYRARSPFAFGAGGLALSLGAHTALQQWQHGDITAWTALLTQAFFALAWLLARETSGEGRLDPELHGGARILGLAHGALGLLWLALAAAPTDTPLTVQPLILLLLGLSLLRDGVAARRHEAFDFGFTFLVAWVPFQVLGLLPHRPWDQALIEGLALAGATLGGVILAARRFPCTEELRSALAVSLSGLQRFWRLLTVAACLVFAGPRRWRSPSCWWPWRSSPAGRSGGMWAAPWCRPASPCCRCFSSPC